ncbi:MAG: AraC family transcriptional regulator [Leptospiraceae bacterium]|nr:AraC family transcriptional regulator [Leptospiraceae bacterium]
MSAAALYNAFSAGLCALFALGELFSVRHDRTSRLLIWIFLDLGIIITHANLVLLNRIFDYPWLFQIQLPAVFSLGPLLWLFFFRTLNQKKPRWPLTCHLLPAAAALLFLVWFHSHDESTKRELMERILQQWHNPQGGPFSFLFGAGILHLSAYMIRSSGPILPLLAWQHLRSQVTVRIIIFIIIMCLLINGIGLISISLRWLPGLHASLLLISSMPPIIYLIRLHYPQYFRDLQQIVSQAKYQRSRLAQLDTASLQRRLHQLMESERLYLDEDLNLADLAAALDIDSHQLSELLNNDMGLGFHQYVNQLRIQAACQLLVEEPGRTVLSVLYASGFNSKSAFNTAFRKSTGMTPQQYRRSQGADVSMRTRNQVSLDTIGRQEAARGLE